MPPLKNVLKYFLKLLQKTKKTKSLRSFSLIGGFAVSARARPRATQDIDFLIDADNHFYTETLPKLLKNTPYSYKIFKSSLNDPLHRLVRIYDKEQEIVDLIPVFWKWQHEALERAEEIEIEKGLRIPVLQTEDLIIFKLYAGGPQDLVDVQALIDVAKANATLDTPRLLNLAKRLKLNKKLSKFL